MIRVEKIIPGGYGLSTMKDGKKIFLWNALPGEIVEEYDIMKSKSHFIEAIATKIKTPSSHRVSPLDACFLSTSPWQIMNYDYELELKKSLVVEIFREHHLEIPTPAIFTDGRDYYYRNKMEYALYWNNDEQKIELAFHARGSHRKTPITKSSLERQEVFAAAKHIVEELNLRHEEARTYQSLLLRCNQKGQISGGLYENGQPHPQFDNLTDIIMGHKYSYSPNGFFQINLPVYEMALSEIAKHISTDNVLDLYSGVGTIGLSVARNHHLTLVECDKSAFTEMAKNITIEDISEPGRVVKNCKVAPSEMIRSYDEEKRADPVTTGVGDAHRGRSCLAVLAKSEEALDYLASDQTVILDPPRAGLDRKLTDKLLEVTPEKIIYLSCNPATQARDIAMLTSKYRITTIKTYNFFPHTPHIENLVVLSL